MAGWEFIVHHLDAHLLDFRNIRQRLNAASPAAYVRWSDTKHFRGSPIEASHLAVAVDHDDRNIDRIKDPHDIRAYGLGRNVAVNRDLRFAFFGHPADGFEP